MGLLIHPSGTTLSVLGQKVIQHKRRTGSSYDWILLLQTHSHTFPKLCSKILFPCLPSVQCFHIQNICRNIPNELDFYCFSFLRKPFILCSLCYHLDAFISAVISLRNKNTFLAPPSNTLSKFSIRMNYREKTQRRQIKVASLNSPWYAYSAS